MQIRSEFLRKVADRQTNKQRRKHNFIGDVTINDDVHTTHVSAPHSVWTALWALIPFNRAIDVWNSLQQNVHY